LREKHFFYFQIGLLYLIFGKLLCIAMKQRLDLLLLLLIVFIGFILRFYGFFEIPMTHDELSAFYRLQFDTFGELIKKGVKVDGHPAGIQVFLYYWTKLGTSDWFIKLPFLLSGLASIVLSYSIGKKWFSSTSGLLVAAYIATLQFSVMYSQIARPYISGLFFSLLMVWFWTRYFVEKERKTGVLIGWVLAAVACCYNHHFSLLFAFIVGFTGLLFLTKETIKPYFTSLIAILLWYIPHVEIFFYQFTSNRGLSWLAPPKNSFLIDHIQYIFHYHPLVYIGTFILALCGFALSKDSFKSGHKLRLVALFWFLTPLLVGFFYSIYVKPVIQHSMLIFSFPFLLLLLFSFKDISLKIKVLLIISALSINIWTLIEKREHYTIFYKQPCKEFAIFTKGFLENYRIEDIDKEVDIIHGENIKYIAHYLSKAVPTATFTSLFKNPLSSIEFRKRLEKENKPYLIVGNIPLAYLPIVREYYPFVINEERGFTYEHYIFSKKEHYMENATLFSYWHFKDKMNCKEISSKWSKIKERTKEKDEFICIVDSKTEWGPTFETKLVDIVKNRHNFINIGLGFKSEKLPKGEIVCEISKNEKVLDWRSVSLSSFYDAQKQNQWQKAYLSLRLIDIFKQESELMDAQIKIFYWNKHKEYILLDDFSIEVRRGNPYVYALMERF